MKYKYSDSDPLHTIEKGYNEATRFLMFHSTPIEADRLQDALNIIDRYNEFDAKIVDAALEAEFGANVRYVVGREHSVVVYVIPIVPLHFDAERLMRLQRAAIIDEVDVTNEGRLRLWWD